MITNADRSIKKNRIIDYTNSLKNKCKQCHFPTPNVKKLNNVTFPPEADNIYESFFDKPCKEQLLLRFCY